MYSFDPDQPQTMAQPGQSAASALRVVSPGWKATITGKARNLGFVLGSLVVLVAVVGMLGANAQARAPAAADTQTGLNAMAEVALATLPIQAQRTHALILKGGPFPYDKDGTVFFNRERLLPLKSRGHYREYTVRTPGVRHRGARRIVCGGKPPTQPEVCFYTADHYASFSRIVP